MPSKRDVLALLIRDELLEALDRCDGKVTNRRAKDALVDALGASHRARLSEILEALPRERLKELCRAFALDDSGRQKAPLVERLAGDGARRPEQTSGARPRREPSAHGAATPGSPRGELSTTELEKRLWAAADALRNNMDAAEYKHVVLGLIFLKYISDAFEAKRDELASERDQGADPEDPDEYRAANGTLVDDAMTAIERDNASLKDVLPKDYAPPGLDKQRLGQLINLVSDVGLGSPADRAKDILGHVYEYFLAQFASAEGKKGGQFYTPSRVVRVLVEILAPYKGRVYDPCCGSGGMFVSSEKFIEAHAGKIGDIAVYGQESNYTTWRLAKMNLAIRGIDGQIAHGDTFHNDRHPDLKADYVLANPPFNDNPERLAAVRSLRTSHGKHAHPRSLACRGGPAPLRLGDAFRGRRYSGCSYHTLPRKRQNGLR